MEPNSLMTNKINKTITSLLKYYSFIFVPFLIYLFYSWTYPIIFNEDRFFHNLVFDNPDGIVGDYRGQPLWLFIAKAVGFLQIPDSLEFTIIFSVIAITYTLLFKNNPLIVLATMLSPAVIEFYLYYSRQGVATSWFLFFYFITELFKLPKKYKLISFASILIHTFNSTILFIILMYNFFIKKSKSIFNNCCILMVLISFLLRNYIKPLIEYRVSLNTDDGSGKLLYLFVFLFIAFVVYSSLKDFNYSDYIIICLFFCVQLVTLSVTSGGVRSSYGLILIGTYFLHSKYIKLISVLYL